MVTLESLMNDLNVSDYEELVKYIYKICQLAEVNPEPIIKVFDEIETLEY